MPDDELVVSDTSPLLNLALIDQLGLVREQFSTVIVPEQVWDELLAGEDGVPGLRALRDDDALTVDSVPETPLFAEFLHELDRGEAAALTYAVETDADLVLLDERDARQVARRHGLSITGVVGILLRAALEEQIDLQTNLDALRDAGFWLSEELYTEALEQVDKNND